MKFSCRMSLLVIHKILELFVNLLTADDKYSLLNRDNLAQPIIMQLSNNKNALSQVFTAILISRSNSKHFEKKMNLVVYVFAKLRTKKNVVR